MSTTMSVRFWGVRGSIPCPGPNTVRYGGNTSCVEVRCGEHLLVFDAGSGLRLLGGALAEEAAHVDIDLFLSHCHIDHLIGLPFFVPAFVKGNRLRLWAGNLKPAGGVKETVRKLMSYPLFPIEIEAAQGSVAFTDFDPGDVLTPRPGIKVTSAALNHPGGATGYRVEFGGRAMAYITDTELSADEIDPALLALARDASIVIIDTTYTDEELPEHVGWGHSSWQQAVRLANEAGVGKLYLFHHDPEHDDDEMDRIAEAAAKARPGTVVAREGLSIEI
ncbi:MBL fold metallo-hydrolase [Bradyrhizobium sp. G127]|uniref:MBL fold metallo-hydrolase n=1 Tax=Bradyrhizobium sp. G127 TaxID=2904800 RepID=UPI001F403229|nr:MBL fold metallo-hydrolase [Bradyrhizobium sp. G127]MCF2523638.1 MBL fold metallo-hydrolase [Bradyrhizobium sp. G127]